MTSGVKHIENELKLNERKRGLEYDALQRQAADSLKHTELPALLEKAEIERIETANSTKEKELFLTRELGSSLRNILIECAHLIHLWMHDRVNYFALQIQKRQNAIN